MTVIIDAIIIYPSITIAAPKELFIRTAVIIVRTPASIIAKAPKRLDFRHVLSLYILQLTLTPTVLFIRVFVMKFPSTMKMIPIIIVMRCDWDINISDLSFFF